MDYAYPSRWSRGVSVLGGIALIALVLAILSFRSVDWFLLKRSLRVKFPGESWITTQQLADRLANDRQPAPILLDVRTEAEWKVSHLLGARRVDPGAPAKTAAGDIALEQPIVTYCSVGYRSGEMARRLRGAGFTDVRNLEGSIFEWANEGRPLERDGKRVATVHPYNATWAHFLRQDLRAPLPMP